MPFNEDQVIFYLLSRGVLRYKDVVESGVSVAKIIGHKPIFKVALPKTSFVVKQVSAPNNPGLDLDREYFILSAAQSFKEFRKLRSYLPKIRFYDSEQKILISEFLPHDSGLMHLRREAVNPKIFARRIGKILSILHSINFKKFQNPESLRYCFPYILDPDHIDIKGFGLGKAANILNVLSEDKKLCRSLTVLGKKWRNDALIHCDIKLDNIIISTMNHKHEIWIIDWATTSVGDPIWDLATLTQSCLSLWLNSINFRGKSFAEAIKTPLLSWGVPKKFLYFLLQQYIEEKKISGKKRKEFIRKVIGYAGAALIASEISNPNQGKKLTKRQLLALQFGRNLVVSPDSFSKELWRGEAFR